MTFRDKHLKHHKKTRLVAITSVLLALILMTTISYYACFAVFAVGEDGTGTEAAGTEGTGTTEGTGAEGTGTTEGTGTEGTGTEGADGTDGTTQEGAGGEAAEGQDGEQADGTGQAGTVLTDEDKENARGLRLEVTMPEVSSSSYIVMSGSTSETVISQYAERKMSPGKITLLVTAMVVIDNMYNEQELNNMVDITEKLASYGDDFKEGESVSVGDLLNAMLVGGSTQAAEALVSYSASKRKIFVSEMNSKALALELMDTQFSNPTGNYSTKHYASASDCAVIAQAAFRYQLIQDAFLLRSVDVHAVSKEGTRTIHYTSTNPLLVSDLPSDLFSYTRGGLTGTMTKPSTSTQYVGVATIDDMQLIVVLMDSDADKIAYEAKGLFEYADTKVTRNMIIKAGRKVGTVRVRCGAYTRVAAYTESAGFAYVPPEGSSDLVQTQVVLFSDIEAPLREGDKVGEYRIYVADELKGTVDLVIRKNVPVGWFPSRMYISNLATTIICGILLLILLFALYVMALKRKKRKIKAARRERKLREIAMQQLEVDEDRKRRNWTYATTYDQIAPRTTDLRREAIEQAVREESSRKKRKTAAVKMPKTEVKMSKTDRKREAARQRAIVRAAEKAMQAEREAEQAAQNQEGMD